MKGPRKRNKTTEIVPKAPARRVIKRNPGQNVQLFKMDALNNDTHQEISLLSEINNASGHQTINASGLMQIGQGGALVEESE